jgi:polyhydroxyalkanoate synthesis regulator phasin
MSDFKKKFIRKAMKAMEDPRVQEILNNEKVQKGMAEAFKASHKVRTELQDKKAQLADFLNLATEDDLRTMKRELDRLQRQVSRLKKQKREQQENDEDSN